MATRDEVFEFLDDLSKSGNMNLFDALFAVAETFDLDMRTVVAILADWLQTRKE